MCRDAGMDDREFGRLLEFLGLSRQGYRKVRKGVKKRVGRHMRSLGCRSLQQYLKQLERRAEVRSQCALALAVPISRFFRDRELWDILENRILPELVEIGKSSIKVWSAGCACGEEVYSLKILWERISRSTGPLPALEITATDLQPAHLEKAAAAVYPASSLREMPEAMISTWFEADAGRGRFRLKTALKGGIAWQRHDFLCGPPAAGFDLVLVRRNWFKRRALR